MNLLPIVPAFGCVGWYCKYGISYRDLEEMVEARGITIEDHHKAIL